MRPLVLPLLLVLLAPVAKAQPAPVGMPSPDAGAAESTETPTPKPLPLAKGPRVVGWLEPLVFPDAKLQVTAKLDTGARTSAIDAEDVEFFERDGERWARFSIRRRRGSDDVRRFEARVVKNLRIRTATGRDVRPVVDLWVCFAGERRRVAFTLGRREHMNYRVILGRRALEGRLAVDSAAKFTTGPGCPSEER